MTYDSERIRIGREPVIIVEFDLDKCGLTYGTAPCTASLASGFECNNTRFTCQDVINYDNSDTLTHKFSDRIIDGQPYLPCISNTKLSPVTITPGQPFGKRASITIKMHDFPHHDRGIDPYVSTRPYSPQDNGTYWGKLMARNPYFQGRPLRLMTGYISADGAINVKTQNYIIENIDGPDSRGRVTIVAKDILKLADDERAQCPVASTGKLEAGVTASSTSLTVTSGTEAEYSEIEIRIGDEIIQAPFANRSGNVFSNLTRAAWNTTASSHDNGDAVQECKHFNFVNVRDIIEDLLVNYAGIPSSYIPTADWDAEKDLWFAGHNLTALITEPTGVKSLTDELSEQILLYMWWDSINQEIKLKAVAPPLSSLVTLKDGENFVGDPNAKTLPDDRKSRVVVYYGPRTPIDFDKIKDFDGLYVDVGADSESVDQHGDIRVKVIFARWITSDSVAVTTASRLRNQFKSTPKIITFIIDAKDSGNVTGDFINIDSRQIQDATGANNVVLSQILSVEEITKTVSGTQFKVIAQQAFFAGRYARIMPTSATVVYSNASNAEKESGCYIATAGGGNFLDGGEGYKIA